MVTRDGVPNVIRCKWIFRIKRNSNESIDQYKASFVAKGFHQKEGIDYLETFSPVVMATTIKLLLSMAISHSWQINQLDVSNAFLHGTLDETVFMEQPLGFQDPQCATYVYALQCSLYGLKQGPETMVH